MVDGILISEDQAIDQKPGCFHTRTFWGHMYQGGERVLQTRCGEFDSRCFHKINGVHEPEVRRRGGCNPYSLIKSYLI